LNDHAGDFCVLPPSLRAERCGAVAVLRLHRAEKRNALNDTTVQGMVAFFDSLPDDIRAVGFAAEALTAALAQGRKEAKKRLKAFLEKRGPKVVRG
jgi:hypothetical protein